MILGKRTYNNKKLVNFNLTVKKNAAYSCYRIFGKGGGNVMKRWIMVFFLVLTLFNVSIGSAFAGTVNYSSSLFPLSSGSVFGQSITEWSGQGIFCDGSVSATLWRWSSGEWVSESGATDSDRGSEGCVVVHPEGYNSGSYYCETATHGGDFWSGTKTSESEMVLCP